MIEIKGLIISDIHLLSQKTNYFHRVGVPIVVAKDNLALIFLWLAPNFLHRVPKGEGKYYRKRMKKGTVKPDLVKPTAFL